MSKPHLMLRNRRLLPTIAGLSAFDAVARTASFTAAAADLALTQSAVSREIKSLEQRLAVKLFNRTRQGAFLTPAGLSYARRVQRVLNELASATDEVIEQGCERSTLRIGILPTFGAKWLLPRMPDFFLRHPTIEVNFLNHYWGVVDFDQENLDAAICVSLPEWPGARLFSIASQELIPVASPAIAAKMSDPSDLLSTTLLGYANQTQDWTEWFAHAALEVSDKQSSITFETYQMLLQAAVVGLGVAIVPIIIVQQELAAGDLVTLFGPPVSTGKGVCFAYPNAKESHAPLMAFRDWLLSGPVCPVAQLGR